MLLLAEGFGFPNEEGVMGNVKSENRKPKTEGSSKSEGRICCFWLKVSGFGFRISFGFQISDFGFPSVFGFRFSDFSFHPML